MFPADETVKGNKPPAESTSPTADLNNALRKLVRGEEVTQPELDMLSAEGNVPPQLLASARVDNRTGFTEAAPIPVDQRQTQLFNREGVPTKGALASAAPASTPETKLPPGQQTMFPADEMAQNNKPPVASTSPTADVNDALRKLVRGEELTRAEVGLLVTNSNIDPELLATARVVPTLPVVQREKLTKGQTSLFNTEGKPTKAAQDAAPSKPIAPATGTSTGVPSGPGSSVSTTEPPSTATGTVAPTPKPAGETGGGKAHSPLQ
jgi:hypothetical protein